MHVIEPTRDLTPDERLGASGRRPNFIKQILLEAHRQKASDIRFEPLSDRLIVRFRIAGAIREFRNLSYEQKENKSFASEIVTEIKRLSGLDTFTRKVLQDGSFRFCETASTYRVTVSPGSGFGECSVLRINRDEDIPSLTNLGLSEQALADFQWASRQHQGLIIVTGPTGSGKTTTLQACLFELDLKHTAVVTAEAPVERYLPYVLHQEITSRFSWTDAISFSLRADPDVILIGELKEKEPAKKMVEGANTGHLVFTTLHTNSAVDTISRLIGFDIDPEDIADNILLVTAQRLMKKLCDNCKLPYSAGFTRDPNGCDQCNLGIVKKGKVPLVEYLKNPDPDLIKKRDYSGLSEALSQSLINELKMAAERGVVDFRLYEDALKKGKF